MKRKIAMLMALMMAASLFSGCGEEKDAGVQSGTAFEVGDTGGLTLPLDDSNTKISMMVVSSKDGINDKLVFQKLREITGLDIEVMAFPNATAGEKLKVLMASKNMPDLMGSGLPTYDEINDLGVQGAFASVNDHLDIMPNFKSIFYDDPQYNWIFKSYQASDGKLYIMPWFDVQRDVNHGMMYRKDIFDKNGLKEWNNTQEFYEAMKKLKQIYPESTPFTSKNKDNLFSQLSISWGISAYGPYYDEDQKVWNYSDTDPQMKDMLDFLRKMYQEGLIDPEFLTLTEAAWTSKMTQPEKAFATFDWIGRLDTFKEQTATTYPDYDLRYANPMGPKGTAITLSKTFAGSVVANNKNTELACKLNDFLLSPAGAQLVTMGVEGETYTMGEDGKADYIGFEEGKKIGIGDLEDKYGLFTEGLYRRFDRRSNYFDFSEREQEAQDKIVKNNKFEPQDPILSFTNEEKEITTDRTAKLRKAAQEFFSNYVLGANTGDQAWAQWCEKAKSLGCEDVVKVYNDAQKRFDAQQ